MRWPLRSSRPSLLASPHLPEPRQLLVEFLAVHLCEVRVIVKGAPCAVVGGTLNPRLGGHLLGLVHGHVDGVYKGVGLLSGDGTVAAEVDPANDGKLEGVEYVDTFGFALLGLVSGGVEHPVEFHIPRVDAAGPSFLVIGELDCIHVHASLIVARAVVHGELEADALSRACRRGTSHQNPLPVGNQRERLPRLDSRGHLDLEGLNLGAATTSSPASSPSPAGRRRWVDPDVSAWTRVVGASDHELLAVDHDPELLPRADPGRDGHHVSLPVLVRPRGGVAREGDAEVLAGPHARRALNVDPGVINLHLESLPSADTRGDDNIVELVLAWPGPVSRRLPSPSSRV